MSRSATIDRAHRCFIALIVVVLGLVLPSVSARAADAFPGNVISGMSGSFSDANTAATAEAGEPTTFGGGVLNTNWYNWTAPASGTVTFQTCSTTLTNFDTTLKAYSGTTFAGLTTLAANDDACANTTPNAFASLIGFPVVAGTNYKIQVDGYGNGTGNYLLSYNLPRPTVTIANTTNGAEAAAPTNGVMTVTQSAISTTNTVISYTVGGSATSGSDYTALSGTVTILAGATTATISIPVLDDAIVEGSETAAITLSGVTSGVAILGATVLATNTIADNDTATLTIANTTNGAETGPTPGTMTVTQSAVSSANTVVSYSIGGTATSGSDYTALSGTVTILAGATTATISIPVLNDALVEGSETVAITLTAPTTGLITLSATVLATNIIADNDSATVSIANATNGAEAGPTVGTMTVTQTALSATNTVLTYSVGGTATSGSDYTALSGTVTILAGNTTATITIPVLNDLTVEGNETVAITLTGSSSGLVTLSSTVLATNTIADNDTATVSIANTTNGTEAGSAAGTMTVTQSAISSTDTVITYTVGGTATSGSDYTALSGTVTILAGATTATISIPVINDVIVEGSETVILTLTAATSNALITASGAATNTIADNDTATISIANTTNGAEAGGPTNGVMTVTQSAVSSTNTVVTYTVGGSATSGSDYTVLSGTVTILAGATTATISIPVINDALVEGNETVAVTLTAPTTGLVTLSATVLATNTIADNDSATVSIANTTDGAEAISPTNGTLTVTQTAVSATNTVLTYSVGGTATSGSDYTALSGTVTILAGALTATISIPVLDNLVVEPSETVIITLTGISGLATLGSPLIATNTIADNDVAAFTISKAVNLTNVATPSTLNYTITVASTGNVPLTAPVLTDSLSNISALTLTSGPTLTSGDAAPLGVLGAGETWVYAATYAVTQANINNGSSITNYATFDTAETVASTSNTVTTTITQNPHLIITKSASTAGPVPVNAVITYTYEIFNDGNITMIAVDVGDIHNGSGPLVGPTNETLTDVAPLLDSTDGSTDGVWDALAPGDTVTFTATYSVTQHDVDYLQ